MLLPCLTAMVCCCCYDGCPAYGTAQVVLKNITRLCATKPIVTVNGKFPGPTLLAREDDTVIVRVVNHVEYNITIHWHGVRQFRTGWADGPAYITQCPIQPGQSYIYNFTITGQRGTLLWHAHITWLRATVHGAIVILPKRGVPYPFPKPDKEEIIVFGYTLHVETGKTYMLRIINAAVNDELFFKIAGHNLTIVEVDATYTKPFKTDTLFIAPGQTTNALLTADQTTGKYLIAISPFMDTVVAVDNLTATGALRAVANINNISFVMPTTALLQAHYYNISGIFTDDFPGNPAIPYNYTGNPPSNLQTMNGTKVYRVAFNSTVQVVLQGTAFLAPESHPIHLHGFNFYAIGKGVGNFDPVNDPKKFNLVDPVERNTIGIPTGGWSAIRFRADNPGVWFLHCHLEVHTTWGLKMAFVVDNGKGPNETILPPPTDLPMC
ncbi:hypothetical protein RHMOL_Rhmol03G0160800 [Rhododendron molle]|uniref:Uncharacterized protein n=1 Tax=Rhododendron molle TaxID=49168 RepID=A0ACC0PG72_RHOML|nr:hypothetical protein RHMOL_Rhmol03G0160800 [Rhododendron molle]